MRIQFIIFLPKFSKQWNRLSPEVQIRAQKTILLLRKDPFHPSLRLHRLHGNFKQYWSISIDRKNRIILRITGDTAHCFSIGSHAIYEKR